ncbi:MAG: hypothetical protein HOW73_01860 [Polyangiaceae bacterium]|nr:hypothetical protein [Polyangiaceae bacterium]
MRSKYVWFWAVLAVSLAISAVVVDGGRRWLQPPPAPGEEQEAQGNPLASYALPASERMRFTGRVLQRIDTGSYAYLEIEREGGVRAWVVTLASTQGAIGVQSEVRVIAVGYAPHFDSKRLERSFDGLYFAVVRKA